MTVLAEASQAPPLWRNKLGLAVVYELEGCESMCWCGGRNINLAGSGESRGYEA